MALYAVLPFVLTLLGIAALPLLAPRWWEHPRSKAVFALLTGLPAAAYLSREAPALLSEAAHEYASFILLIGALFVIAGGIVLRGELRPTPLRNTALLALGSVLASVVGTTGASMLLIRPLLRANRVRSETRHLPLFFIFIVSNAGGLLTPLGDPPLFLGFLHGVPFTWTLQLFPTWLAINAFLLGLFFLVDGRALEREGQPPPEVASSMKLAGLSNLIFLVGVVAAAALLAFPLREGALLLCAALSWWRTPRALREENGFTFGPIIEVAILFAAIFVSMQPALALLRQHGPALGVQTPRDFFLASGLLSSVLDNAPTYLTFFTIAQSLAAPGAVLVAGVPEPLLRALSLGSVLMGANTYIGNGPNFMVKSICEEGGVRTPSFFAYAGYAALILGPIWALLALTLA